MIATGTDIKPVGCLIFMRDVKSEGYFGQMKGRGVRTLKDADLRQVTPDAQTKTRFVIIDAVGVTEGKNTLKAPDLDDIDSRPPRMRLLPGSSRTYRPRSNNFWQSRKPSLYLRDCGWQVQVKKVKIGYLFQE